MKASRGEIYQKLSKALYEEGKHQPDLAAIAMDLESRWINQGYVPLLKPVEADRLPPDFVAEGISLASHLDYMGSPMLELSRMDAIAMAAIMAGEAELAHEKIRELQAQLDNKPKLILPHGAVN